MIFTTFKKHPLFVCCVALLTLGCGENNTPEGDNGVIFANAQLGLEISEFGEWESSQETNLRNQTEMFGEATVSIEGKGTHSVEAYALIDSVENGAMRTLATTDLDTNVESVFHYEPEENLIVIGDFDGGVFVFANPDGSFDVVSATFKQRASKDEHVTTNDGYEAFKIVAEFNDFKSTSPHGAVMAFAMGGAPLLDAKSSGFSGCVNLECDGGDTSLPSADGPAVCDSFPEFCVCVGCWSSGKVTDSCAPCGLE